MSARSSILIAVSAAVAAGACGDISSPSRSDIFEWRGTAPNIDGLTFHWLESRLPVKIWVEDSLGLPGHTAAGIETWKEQFLYGEWDAVIVTDSSTADVVIGFSIMPAIRSIKLFSAAPGCSAVTSFPLPVIGSTIALPFRVRITNLSSAPTSPEAQFCYAITVAHELGHTMGLLDQGHTGTEETDLMFHNPVSGPTARDRNTIQRLYHTEPDLTASR